MRFRFPQPVPTEEVRRTLAGAGLQEYAVQQATDASLGDVVLVRTEPLETAKQEQVKQTLAGKGGEFLGTETIGPSVANEVALNAFLAVLAASLMIVAYLAFRFAIGGLANGLKYGVCAVLALLHNVIAVTGLFALMGFLADWRIDSLFVTAMLTVIGYSVHDTIVVYDRIRENLRGRQRGETFEEIANKSITQTFDRSITTGLTVIIVLAALLIWGGSVTKLFNVALLAGIFVGTYSSIFVASPLVTLWERLTVKTSSTGRRGADVGFANSPARRALGTSTAVTAGRGTPPLAGSLPRQEAPSEGPWPPTKRRERLETGTIKPKRRRRM
jgi:preprotein translocase SecF subunit